MLATADSTGCRRDDGDEGEELPPVGRPARVGDGEQRE
jgi:hypothetical protein